VASDAADKALTNPWVIAILVAFIGVVFIGFYAVLWTYGLVTAAICFMGGVLLLYLVGRASPDALKAYPVLQLIPVALGGFGYAVDHLQGLALLSLGGGALQTLDNRGYTVVNAGLVFLLIAVALVFVVVVAAAKRTRKRKKRER
jgi:hypothetical protein